VKKEKRISEKQLTVVIHFNFLPGAEMGIDMLIRSVRILL
jgi:hypothetical protein